MDKIKETETKLIDDLTVHDLQGKEVLLCHLFYCHTQVKDILCRFLFSIDFFYIYGYCRKFNTEFNKLIKTVGHRACFFGKNDFEHNHLCQQF